MSSSDGEPELKRSKKEAKVSSKKNKKKEKTKSHTLSKKEWKELEPHLTAPPCRVTYRYDKSIQPKIAVIASWLAVCDVIEMVSLLPPWGYSVAAMLGIRFNLVVNTSGTNSDQQKSNDDEQNGDEQDDEATKISEELCGQEVKREPTSPLHVRKAQSPFAKALVANQPLIFGIFPHNDEGVDATIDPPAHSSPSDLILSYPTMPLDLASNDSYRCTFCHGRLLFEKTPPAPVVEIFVINTECQIFAHAHCLKMLHVDAFHSGSDDIKGFAFYSPEQQVQLKQIGRNAPPSHPNHTFYCVHVRNYGQDFFQFDRKLRSLWDRLHHDFALLGMEMSGCKESRDSDRLSEWLGIPTQRESSDGVRLVGLRPGSIPGAKDRQMADTAFVVTCHRTLVGAQSCIKRCDYEDEVDDDDELEVYDNDNALYFPFDTQQLPIIPRSRKHPEARFPFQVLVTLDVRADAEFVLDSENGGNHHRSALSRMEDLGCIDAESVYGRCAEEDGGEEDEEEEEEEEEETDEDQMGGIGDDEQPFTVATRRFYVFEAEPTQRILRLLGLPPVTTVSSLSEAGMYPSTTRHTVSRQDCLSFIHEAGVY